MKYLVMECHLSYAVVLSEDGRFLKVANRQYETGQTVTDIIEMEIPQPEVRKKKTNRWMYSAAAAAACLLVAVTSVFRIGQMPYASVYMTINPEVRIDVNRRDVVVDLDGVNADGDALIEDYTYKKKDLDLVMDELVDRAIDMGYLHEGGQISLVLEADSDEWVIDHSSTLTTHLSEYLDEKISVTIEVSDMDTQIGQVVIPAAPPQNHETESDYGDSDYAQAAAIESPAESGFASERDYEDSVYGDSRYENSAYGDSSYGDGLYGDGSFEGSNYGDSDYGNSAEVDRNDDEGQSDYEMDEDESDYGETEEDGLSVFDDEEEEADSDYDEVEDENDGESEYEEPDPEKPDDEDDDTDGENDDSDDEDVLIEETDYDIDEEAPEDDGDDSNYEEREENDPDGDSDDDDSDDDDSDDDSDYGDE